jgi:beta-lactamase regulating signal transducer with metallopeptidase domain
MNMPLWFSNLMFWSIQITLLVLAAGFPPRLFQIRQPRVLLAYWRALLAISLLLPFVQPWHRAQIMGVITGAPDIAVAIPPSSSAVTHWHFLSVQIIAQIVGLIILAGIAVRFVIVMLGLLKLRQLRQRSSPIPTVSESAAVLEEMRARVNTRAEFRLSAEVDSPVTFGFAAPVILLPERFASMDAGFQAVIACHELLHVRRRDWAHHLAEEILRAALWFHPAIAWLIARVRLAREQVVDLQVVGLTEARKTYLEALLEFTASRARAVAIPAPPFLGERQLAERVALMLKEVRMSRKRLIASLTAIACWLALAATLAVWSFPLKAAARSAQNPPRGGVSQGIPGGVAGEAAGPKIVVTDLRIDGDVHDVDDVRARILKGLEGREFESKSPWQDEIAVNVREDFQDRGYFKVVADHAQGQPLDLEKRRMLFIVQVDEGEQYRTADISVVSGDADRALVIPEQELRQQFQLRTGDLFDVDQVRKGLRGIYRLYGARGYAEATVIPEFVVSDKNHSIASTMYVREGNQYRVGSFDVRGLDSKTKALLEARMRPGSLFSGTLLNELFDQGKVALGANVSLCDVVHVKRNVEEGTADVLLDFSASAPRTN